jgi:hypothetical protein
MKQEDSMLCSNGTRCIREMQCVILQRVKATLQKQRIVPMQLDTHTDPLLQKALDDQDELGWDQFLLGRQTKRWEELQHKEYARLAAQLPANSSLPAHFKSIVFSKMLIQEATYISLNRWQVHNEVARSLRRNISKSVTNQRLKSGRCFHNQDQTT